MKNILFYFVLLLDVVVLFILLSNSKNVKNTIKVEIKGAVANAGVYELKEDSVVEDLIKESGGLLENADISVTNLSKVLSNEMVVFIYTKEEINELTKGNTSIKYIDKECVCPKLQNNACLDEVVYNYDNPIISEGKISLNSATIEELMTLPGIGEGKALKIIEYRDTNNGFKSIEELMNVKGIGKSIYEKIKDYIIL